MRRDVPDPGEEKLVARQMAEARASARSGARARFLRVPHWNGLQWTSALFLASGGILVAVSLGMTIFLGGKTSTMGGGALGDGWTVTYNASYAGTEALCFIVGFALGAIGFVFAMINMARGGQRDVS